MDIEVAFSGFFTKNFLIFIAQEICIFAVGVLFKIVEYLYEKFITNIIIADYNLNKYKLLKRTG
jgi:hypothetical protein